AGLECAADDHGIAVHAEDEDRQVDADRTQSTDQVESAETFALDGKIDDHDIGGMTPEQAAGFGDAPGLQDLADACVFQNTPAALQEDWRVVANETFRHVCPCPASSLDSGASRAMTTSRRVPPPGSLMTERRPPSVRTLSSMPLQPMPGTVPGAMPLPSSRTDSRRLAAPESPVRAGTDASSPTLAQTVRAP